MQTYRIFFLLSCLLSCLFFFHPFTFFLTSFLSIFFLTISFQSLHCPGWTSSFSLGFIFELLFCNLRLKKEYSFFSTLFCARWEKGNISILFLTCTNCERGQFTWSYMTDPSWVACLFILINTFREMVRLQPKLWGEDMGKQVMKERYGGSSALCLRGRSIATYMWITGKISLHQL